MEPIKFPVSDRSRHETERKNSYIMIALYSFFCECSVFERCREL